MAIFLDLKFQFKYFHSLHYFFNLLPLDGSNAHSCCSTSNQSARCGSTTYLLEADWSTGSTFEPL